MSADHRRRTARTASAENAGGRTTLEFSRFLPHPPERVWAAITEPELVRQWFLTSVSGSQKLGGTISLETGPARASGRILAWDPPRLYEYEWNIPEGVEAFPGERSTVRWELTAVPGGTRLALTHRDLRPPTAQVFRRGLSVFLDRLEALLDGRAMRRNPLEPDPRDAPAHRGG